MTVGLNTGVAITLGGEAIVLLPQKALYWPAERLLVVADLHLEKATARRHTGVLLPPYDTRETLARLLSVVRDVRPETVLALGDSFHDAAAVGRLDVEARASLATLATLAQPVWLIGNHDPALPPTLPGTVVPFFARRSIGFVHEPSSAVIAPEVAGHLHPKARVRVGGHAVVRPCFVVGGGRVILPAFGAYTGGLDVTAPPIRSLFGGGGDLYVPGRDRLYRVPLMKT
ncbi:putative ICC-like phosphoesterase [Ameyamaea chiangmaiensis NBRC 103196]|uniref:Ligase-associated DNA damage response endonuclease PdeM n=1 Tax=Ameyamaea chiangmaiensis TaxID=442969 RepID=A0A850PBN6_9PROT|nr:ligase-associated DNA damage response endonuclease PdeM [Ameyamaea chiangmaiensis]MBS4074129.1 ligase-associated DNA damage response endonuclease PdeM [Ameyamaea chiangmaiensis]NVN39940.1 ligase-associated DNA damage response endonuclease PdeM [Ameyamaea chiangmaiensis]GBQ70979.1 putative ICC-like phosphoesterase [Ameyamaea chiangmaiensis NBRC 103196]